MKICHNLENGVSFTSFVRLRQFSVKCFLKISNWYCLQEEIKLKNLASMVLDRNDVKTGMKSAIKALGASNPFTINTAGEVSTTVTVQGGMMIDDLILGKIDFFFNLLILT